MSAPEFFLRLVLVTAGIVAIIGFFLLLLRHAKRAPKALRGVGATLMLLGWGFMRDPRNDTVAEAQDARIRKGESTGDPPTP
jgi:hypothetical protein